MVITHLRYSRETGIWPYSERFTASSKTNSWSVQAYPPQDYVVPLGVVLVTGLTWERPLPGLAAAGPPLEMRVVVRI